MVGVDPCPVIVVSFFILLVKYFRWSDLVLNVYWLIKASGGALGAVWSEPNVHYQGAAD